MRSLPKLTWISLFLLLLAGLAVGQSFFGSIGGTVLDPNNAVVPGAEVTLLDLGTGVKRTTTTNAEGGNYSFANLPLGTYTVTVARSGFKEARSSSIILTTSQAVRFDTTLEVGEVTETVDVTQPHGSAFYVTSNNALNAKNLFAASKPKGPISHEFGGSIGGPIFIPKLYDGHNRSFFYFTWEQQKFPSPRFLNGNVPTLKMRKGDFSELLPKTAIVDPATGQPFLNNIIPSTRMSTVALKMQDFGFLEPNNGPADQFSANWRGFYPYALQF